MLVLDAHLHLWDVQRLHYHWLTPADPLYRTITPAEVARLMADNGVSQALLVEAANHSAEIPYLLELLDAHPWIAGIIPWASEADPPPAALMPRLRGVRLPWLQPDATVTLPASVREHTLPCDIIAGREAYAAAAALVRSAPELTFILAHLGLPTLAPGAAPAWARDLAPLAALPNLVMKLSGYLTAADPRPLAVATLRDFVDEALRLFGPQRLLWGSNYPIGLRAGSYAEDIGLLRQATAHLPAATQVAIFGDNARRVYGLEPLP
ncbi:MAG: amidohydrolase family protein [Anaerolineae bacterium]|jgi:L-fuconolactonase|nr:amidohydrolase family protein [Anaerolineae bacterium]